MATGFKYTWSCEAEGSVVEEAIQQNICLRHVSYQSIKSQHQVIKVGFKKWSHLSPFIITK